MSGKPSASGLGVNTACVPPKGATLAVFGSEQASTSSMSSSQRAQQVDGQAGDVVAAADHERGGAELARARQQQVEALVHQPGAGQALAVPQHGGRPVGDDERRAVARIVPASSSFT